MPPWPWPVLAGQGGGPQQLGSRRRLMLLCTTCRLFHAHPELSFQETWTSGEVRWAGSGSTWRPRSSPACAHTLLLQQARAPCAAVHPAARGHGSEPALGTAPAPQVSPAPNQALSPAPAPVTSPRPAYLLPTPRPALRLQIHTPTACLPCALRSAPSAGASCRFLVSRCSARLQALGWWLQWAKGRRWWPSGRTWTRCQ